MVLRDTDPFDDDNMDSSRSEEPIHSVPFAIKDLEMRFVVGFVCVLSMIGAVLIILSYAFFKSLRSRAREILVHISLMDFGVAACNLIGIIVHWGHYYHRKNCLGLGVHAHPYLCPVSTAVQDLCVTQAFFAEYFTLGSILWTIRLSVYLYFLVIHHGVEKTKYMHVFSYVFGYGLPLLVTLWLVLTERLGYAPYDSAGWCSLIAVRLVSEQTDVYASIMGYNLWICLAIVLVPILSIAVHIYVRQEIKKSSSFLPGGSDRYRLALQSVDYKFLLIPVVFVLLRIWSLIMDILFTYRGLHISDFPKPWLAALLINLSGIGDSGQGLANAILFVLFTKTVRDKFISCLCCRRNKKRILTHSQERQKLINAPGPHSRTRTWSQSLERTPASSPDRYEDFLS